jgi:hypothetical protein
MISEYHRSRIPFRPFFFFFFFFLQSQTFSSQQRRRPHSSSFSLRCGSHGEEEEDDGGDGVLVLRANKAEKTATDEFLSFCVLRTKAST